MMKIARHIQQAGLASRREAEEWVRRGRVCVDGVIIRTPASVLEKTAEILLDGKPLPRPDEQKLWRYHKPSGLIVSRRDPQNRPTIFSTLPKKYQNLIAVGRLDAASEGLLLLTNNGALARQLELPKTGLERHYRVRVFNPMKKNITQDMLNPLAEGLVIKKTRYLPAEAQLETSHSGRNHWIKITLREGKNREVRVLMEFLGFQVNRLIRVGFGAFRLGHLPRGALEQISSKKLLAAQKKWER